MTVTVVVKEMLQRKAFSWFLSRLFESPLVCLAGSDLNEKVSLVGALKLEDDRV